MDELLNMDYETLKKYLMNISKIERNKILDNNEIKRKLIDSLENKYEFIWLVQEVDDDLIIRLLSGSGLDFFIETKLVELLVRLRILISKSMCFINKQRVFLRDPHVVVVIL